MNESTPRQQSSHPSFEQVKAQLLASAGNLGDKSGKLTILEKRITLN